MPVLQKTSTAVITPECRERTNFIKLFTYQLHPGPIFRHIASQMMEYYEESQQDGQGWL